MREWQQRMKEYVRQQNSANTRAAYTLDLAKWLYFVGKQQPSVALAVAFKEHIESQYAPNSARRIFATVSAFHEWLRRQGLLDTNPFSVVKRPRVLQDAAPKVLTDVQVERIFRAVDRSAPSGKRHYAILMLLLNGLRASEVCDLRAQDWYRDEATNAPVVRVVGKGMKERIVPLTPEAGKALADYRWNAHPVPGPEMPLIQDVLPMGGKISRKQVSYVVDKYSAKAEVHGVSPHSFRHHYATRLYRATRDVLGVGRLMGHSKPETTMRYARLDLADLVETARMDPRAGLDESAYDATSEAG